MYLTEAGHEAVMGSPVLQGLIAENQKVSIYAVQRWLRDRDDNLTKASVIFLIEKHTGLNRSDIIRTA